ncbi:MAG TPA: hypothetical protein VGM19_12640 [Armatimonadota bacterium]|jgi:hypothetical protein
MTNDSILRRTLAELNLTGRYAGYTPNFRLEEFQPRTYWVLDGDTRVGLVTGDAHTLELTNFYPDEPRAVEYPEVYHAPTAPGDRITLANWVEWEQATTSERHELTFSEGGATLTVKFEEWFADGMHALKVCTFAVDPDMGYVVHTESHVQSPVSHQVEFANFLPERVVEDRVGFVRYPFILWQHPDGRILRWNQNNLGADAYGNRDHYGLRQIDPEGFLGYFGEEDRCPVVEFHSSNIPVSAATCANMLDEHLHWVVARHLQPPQDEAGNYLYEVSFTLGALPGAAGARLAEQAVPNELILDRYPTEMAGLYPWTRGETGPRRPLDFRVFQQGVVCDFTEILDPAASCRGQAITYPVDAPDAPVSVLSTGGRQTAPCLRLQVTGSEETVLASTGEGCSLHLTRDRTYRVSAWIKTDLRSGSARLRASEWLFAPRPIYINSVNISDPVEGVSDWTEVSVEFTPTGPRTHCVLIEFLAAGEGTVWIDEVLMETVA